MAWQAARRKEHHVDPDVVLRPGEARGEHFGRRGDAAQAILVDRKIEILGPVAPFDLDEGDNAAAAGDQIDFADRDAQSLTKDAPAMEAKPPGGTAFGLAPARLGLGAFHPAPLSVSARA